MKILRLAVFFVFNSLEGILKNALMAIVMCFCICCGIATPMAASETVSARDENRLRVVFANNGYETNEIIFALDDNAAAANLVAILPLELEFRDYNGTEKITDLPRKLNVKDSPTTCDPVAGSFIYFIPWGNLAIFYKDFRHSSNLVPLGKIISGLEALQNATGKFVLRLEKANNQ